MTDTDSVGRLPTGISGLDEIALGGLPAGRPTMVSGTTGSGKTVLSAEFLARGVLQYAEPGVFVTFEDSPEAIRRNFASLGFPIRQWEEEGKWAFVDVSQSVAEESSVIGAYDFGALTARIEHAIRKIGASRVALDSLGAIFARFANAGLVRAEIRQLVSALSGLGVTAIMTFERLTDYDGISRYGVEEFVCDNILVLRNKLVAERRRRTIEVVKFRGAPHRSGEWLFTIDPRDGLVVLPLAFLTAPFAAASNQKVSSGVPGLDRMCGGGVYKDAIVLLTGPSGAGKTLTGLSFVKAGVSAGERCLVFTFDETREQVQRNAAGWGMDIAAEQRSGLLQMVCDYPEVASLEDHFIRIRRAIEEYAPSRLVIDTLSALERIVAPRALRDFVISLGAIVRQRGITTLFTAAPAGRLTSQLAPSAGADIASLTDVTIALRYYEHGGEIKRAVSVLQSRGTAHDQAVRQVTIDAHGMHVGEPVTVLSHLLGGDPGSPLDDALGWQGRLQDE